MQKNPFKSLKKHELILWIISVITVAVSNILAGNTAPSTLFGTLIGVTALIFVARGDVWGQVLSVIFCILYGITSYKFRYYGEMITYLCMSMPIDLMSIFTWLRHPAEKNKNEVKIHRLTAWQKVFMIFSAIAVTAALGWVLKVLDTPNLFFSTVSITTSYLASFLMLYRSSYYAVAYAANDIVLIILWILASIDDFSYFPMIICFVMFFINDIYGFIAWKKREIKQKHRSH